MSRQNLLIPAAAATLAMLFPGAFAPLSARAQQSASDSATFEVASVKANKSGDNRIGIGFQPGGRFRATNVTLKMLIAAAYGEARQLPDNQISGGPKWMDADRFDVVAKAEGDPQPGPDGPPPAMFAMLRNLLAERFKLVAHKETRELPIYALVMARRDRQPGPQLKPAAIDCRAMMAAARARGGTPPPPPGPGQPIPCGSRLAPGNLVAGSLSMTMFASVLSRLPVVNRLVVDKTGLTGNYDLNLQWTPDQLPPPGATAPPGAPPLPPIDPNGPSIYTAVQEQLGLKLESERGPVEVVVVDSAEQPTED